MEHRSYLKAPPAGPKPRKPLRARKPMSRGTTPMRQRKPKRARHVAECAAVPKFPYVRSPQILEACRQLACQHCGARDGTVVAAHSNQGKHGKGKGVKASDVYVAALCYGCHAELDQGKDLTEAERVEMWDFAHRKTVAALLFFDLWPVGIEVPA
jgi:hypothetical protein